MQFRESGDAICIDEIIITDVGNENMIIDEAYMIKRIISMILNSEIQGSDIHQEKHHLIHQWVILVWNEHH